MTNYSGVSNMNKIKHQKQTEFSKKIYILNIILVIFVVISSLTLISFKEGAKWGS